jgi:hypothetical protein
MKIFSLISIFCLTTSCATRKTTTIYSALAGVVLGGVVGKALSPNEESKKDNAVLGSLVGGGLMAWVGKKLYENQHPDLKMENSPIEKSLKDFKFSQIEEVSYSPSVKKSSSRRYLTSKGRKASKAPKQYFIEHEVSEKIIRTDGGKKIVYPSFKYLEYGVE